MKRPLCQGNTRRTSALAMQQTQPLWLLLALFAAANHLQPTSVNPAALVVAFSPSVVRHRTMLFPSSFSQREVTRQAPKASFSSSATASTSDEDTNASVTETNQPLSLPDTYPHFAPVLQQLGLSTPTPIQAAVAAALADNSEHEKDASLMLMAPTGSGKTLAYLLPALTRTAAGQGQLVLMVAPTRELAVQLARDAQSLLPTENDDDHPTVLVAVRGRPPPLVEQLVQPTLRVLVGTPPELLIILTARRDLVERIRVVVLDEADVLLPTPAKSMRTALDGGNRKKQQKGDATTAQDERRKREQKRKLMAMQRRGDVQVTRDGGSVVAVAAATPTERILQLVVPMEPQVLAGSATASRKTLDTLNRAVRNSLPTAVPVQAVRPAPESNSSVESPVVATEVTNSSEDGNSTATGADVNGEAPATVSGNVRSVVVPPEVVHRYVALTKTEASSPQAVLSAVAKAVAVLQPETALVFLCGSFGRQPQAVAGPAKVPAPPTKRGTSQARRNKARKRVSASVATKSPLPTLSARQACATLSALGMDAEPLHVALGLEPNAAAAKSSNSATDDANDESAGKARPRCLVTFEGSARGLHLDGVDAVFVVGRPASSASYLHLAGRVGRATTSATTGEILNRPGTVVSLCTKGQAIELQKWGRQIGVDANGENGGIQELVLLETVRDREGETVRDRKGEKAAVQ